MADTKETKTITVGDLQRTLHDLELRYGSRVHIKIDSDFNVQLADQPDLAEESPEESLKRAERQQKEAREAEAKRAETATDGAGKFTVPVESLMPKPTQTVKEREATPTKR